MASSLLRKRLAVRGDQISQVGLRLPLDAVGSSLVSSEETRSARWDCDRTVAELPCDDGQTSAGLPR